MSEGDFNKPWSPEAQAYTTEIRKQQQNGSTSINHNRLSFGIALCEGELFSLQNVYINDDQPIYSGGASSGAISLASSLVEVEDCRLYKGDFVQSQCPILQEINTEHPHPAYRGTAYISFKNWNLKEETTMPNLSFVVQCKTKLYSAMIGNDVNPVGIIHDIMKDYIKIPVDFIDYDNFDTIAAQMESEAFGLSMIFETQNDAWKFIEEVLNHIDGLMYFDTTVSKFKIKLIRNDYNVSTLPLYTEDDLKDFSFNRTSWNSIPNMFTMTYTDGSGTQPKFKSTSMTMINAAARASNNGIVVQDKVSLLGITKAETAQKALERLIIKKCYPYAEIRFKIFYDENFALNIGDVIKINYAPFGLTGFVARVLDIQISEEEKGYLEIYALEDAYSTAQVTASEPEQTLYTPPVYNVPNIDSYNVLEVPAYYANYRAIFILPKKPGIYATEFYAFYSEDNTYWTKLCKQQFNYQATLDAPGYTDSTDFFDLTTGFTVTNIYGLENLTSYTSEKDAQARPYNAVLGTEFISFAKITSLGSGKYKIENIVRKEHYSTKVSHSAGELLYILNRPFDIIPVVISLKNNFYIRVIPKSHFEESYNDSYFNTAITKTINFTNKYLMFNAPYDPHGTHVGTDVVLFWNFNTPVSGADNRNYAMDDIKFPATYGTVPSGYYFVVTYTDDFGVSQEIKTQLCVLELTQTNVHTYTIKANILGTDTSSVSITI